jgi:hypothetical protein
MISVAVAVWMTDPVAPVMVRVQVPLAAPFFVVTVSVDVAAPLETETGLGLKEPWTPRGRPDTLRLTAPLKPLLGITVTA